MKRTTFVAVVLVLLGAAAQIQAHETPRNKTVSITGEVVDAGCFLGHNGRGANHIDCAKMCVNAGMPMAVLTRTGTAYLVTMDHDNADPYNQLKADLGKTVRVTGRPVQRGGIKGVEVTKVQLSSARASR